MSEVIVKEVKTKKQIKEFLNFPLKLYKNNPYFVPPLYSDEKDIFNPDYVYYEQSEAVYFNAYKDNKMVGRISGILQHASNLKWNQKRIRFTRFDSINDQEVANALFKRLEEYAKEKNMDSIVGPLGFSDLEREGLLLEGFDQLSTFEEQYNFEYYKTLIENYGFVKEVDWEERKLYYPKEVDPKLEKLTTMMMKRYNLRLPRLKSTKLFLKKYADQFFEIMDATYIDLYQTVPFTPRVKKMMLKNFGLVINHKYVAVIIDENDKVVAFGLCMPSLAKAVQKSKGHLTLPTIFKILRAVKNPKILDLALIGVLPEYRMKGISTVLILEILKMLGKGKIKYAETNLNLETNTAIINSWKVFDSVLHKRRRSFIKKIE